MRLHRLSDGDWRWLVVVLAVVSVLGVLMVVLVLAPPWFVPGRSLEALKAQNEVRTTLLQGVGGAAVLVGAYFTWRQLQTSREGQITERFTRCPVSLDLARPPVANLRRARSGETPFSWLSHFIWPATAILSVASIQSGPLEAVGASSSETRVDFAETGETGWWDNNNNNNSQLH